MDESILVCVYYGPNGERLIRRGHKLAGMTDCPLYVLTVDQRPSDEFDAEKMSYIEQWQELSEELGVEKFIIKDNESRSSVKAIKEVAYKYNVTDRKSTRLNSSHVAISYAVFCLKKKKNTQQ